MLETFRNLFVGGDSGYGEWDPKREAGDQARTWPGLAPLSAYEKHLSGEIGIGLVPIGTTGLCRFAAVDIDIDTIDHQALYQKVSRRRLPLVVCRSKSGGAHLYVFFREPGLQASKVVGLLKRWAAVLGYPSSEIFPKQTKVGPENRGSWINLPYFGGDGTTRYAVGQNGALSLFEFLGSVKYYDPEESYDESEDAKPSDNPIGFVPCLAALSQQKLVAGSRNSVLFNVAVFYRKSKPADWEEQVSRHNQSAFTEPLTYREVQGVVRSAGRVRYQYTCEQSPIRDYCDRDACSRHPFGLNHMPWKEDGAYDDFQPSNLRRLETNPPRFILGVNGKDLELSPDEFLSFTKFRKKVYESHSLMISPMKQPQWEQLVRDLTSKQTIIDAPEDASFHGLVLEKFQEFLGLRERSISKEDLLRGLPIEQNDFVLFRLSDFRKHLQAVKLDKLDASEVFLLLKNHGCVHRRVRILGKLLTVWGFPLAKVNDQVDDFGEVEFTDTGATAEL